MTSEQAELLAVDLGLRTGVALFDGQARLLAYRSQHFGTRDALRRGLRGILQPLVALRLVVLEGGGSLADLWEAELGRRGIPHRRIGAETWRARWLGDADRHDAARAKARADTLARIVIEWSGARRPTSLRHDAAEAVLIGFWAALEAGWVPADTPLPEFARRG